MNRSTFVIILAVVLATAAGAQTLTVTTAAADAKLPVVDGVVAQQEYGALLDLRRMQVSMTRTADALYVAVSANTTGWVAIGFGSSRMAGATILIGYVSQGALQIKLQRGVGHFHNDLAADVIAATAAREDGGRTTLELKLKPATFIPAGAKDVPAIVAFGNADSFASLHAFKASLNVHLAP